MKKVMILGAAEGQIPFISICKSRGYHTIVVGPEGDYPGFAMADKPYYFDTRDKENILNVAMAEKIDAILTDQTDVAVPTVAYVSEKMGLRGIGHDLALKLTNKYEMRKAAREAGINVPEFARASTSRQAVELAEKIGYPVIIKPLDSSGSRGVIKISSRKELLDNFDATLEFSAAGGIIVEKFIQGREYLADGFASSGEYYTLDVGVKEYFDLPGHYISRLCMFYSVNASLDPAMFKVKAANDKLFRSLAFPFGITHAEYIYQPEEDRVYLVECAGRGGGVFLSSHLTPWASGFDTNTNLIKDVVEGMPAEIRPEKLDNKISAWLCFSLPAGIIEGVSGHVALMDIPGVREAHLEALKPGKKVESLASDKEKYGPILFHATSPREIYKAVDKVRQTLKITIVNGNGHNDIIW